LIPGMELGGGGKKKTDQKILVSDHKRKKTRKEEGNKLRGKKGGEKECGSTTGGETPKGVYRGKSQGRGGGEPRTKCKIK